MISTFGSRLRSLRKQKGLTSEELGSALNMSGKAVTSWERETRAPSLSMLVKIAGYFNVSADYLLGTEEQTSSETSTLGGRIKNLRERRCLSQNSVAEIFGVAQPTWSQYEIDKREPSLSKLVEIADFFDVTTDYLLKGVEPEQKELKKVDASYEAYQTFVDLVADAVWNRIAEKQNEAT